ncbi:MAG TPA: cytochrome c oxidase assembly protein [Pseudonocardia sp.]
MTATAPTWQDVLASWTFPSVAELLVLAATAGYLWLSRRPAVSGSDELARWPAARTASWLGAVLVLVVALDGPVGRFSDVLFWVHMTQHLLLIMIVPLLVVWSQPIRLARRAAGPSGRARLDGVLGSRPFRWATAPLTGLAAYAAVVVLTHLTGFQQLSATDTGVRAVELCMYLLAGYLYFLPLAGSDRGPWTLPHLLRLVLLVVGMGADTLTGVALMLTSRPLAPAYGAAHPGWGPTALADQEVAGAIMWFGGDLLMMLLMIMVAVQWGRAGADSQGLGEWLEGARRRAVLGDAAGAGGALGGDLEGDVDHDGFGPDIDDDQRALDSYNAMLAALNERRGRTAPRGGRDGAAGRADRTSD